MFDKPVAFAVPLRRSIGAASVVMALWAAGGAAAMAQSPATGPVAPVANACQRFPAGSVVQQPPALFSQNGVLNVRFSYQTTTDSFGRQLFCFMTPDGLENPTLHLNPGDTLNVTVTNNTPPVNTTTFPPPANQIVTEPYNAPNCGDTTEIEGNPGVSALNTMTGGSMNIHYHGTNTTPACHGDNVTKTLVNPGSTFSYSILIPADEPPGLYWYHPHVHGLAEAAVQGGGSGLIVVEGIHNVQPATAGLRQRLLIIRDQQTTQGFKESAGGTEGGIPQVDLTVNNISINTFTNTTTGVTSYTPAVIQMAPGAQEFWRVSNSTSNAILDLQVQFDGMAQTIQIVGIDGVPVNSQDGTQPGQLIPVTHFLLPPAARVEFLVNAPPSTVKVARLMTRNILTGPLGDDDPTRPLVSMQLLPRGALTAALPADGMVPAFTALNTNLRRFGGIMDVEPALTRTVYFAENQDGSWFFINASGCVTAAGAQCATQVTNGVPIDTPFDNNNPPSIITTQGTVEKWIIQNRAQENHELHQHQIHFMVLRQEHFEINGSEPAPAINGQFLDMVQVPFCNGPPPAVTPTNPNGNSPPACVDAQGNPVFPYPQVVALMDFRGMDIGDFVFHCHILGHEDLGMMGIERVCPSTGCTN
ncbi:MAG: multicopper oxidase domain-containing protein [Hyphomicrobiales bacterium]|nr:multicopper oxidase domain-containing protein [Hyphomicrobiales bacterium]